MNKLHYLRLEAFIAAQFDQGMGRMILQTFESILENVDSQGFDEFEDDWIGLVRARLTDLEDAYRGLSHPGRYPIDYSEQPTQAAYVFAYGMPRAGFTFLRLKRHQEDLGRKLFRRPEIKVASIGGGPASELVGLLQYLRDGEADEDVASIEYTVFDHNSNW